MQVSCRYQIRIRSRPNGGLQLPWIYQESRNWSHILGAQYTASTRTAWSMNTKKSGISAHWMLSCPSYFRRLECLQLHQYPIPWTSEYLRIAYSGGCNGIARGSITSAIVWVPQISVHRVLSATWSRNHESQCVGFATLFISSRDCVTIFACGQYTVCHCEGIVNI